MKSRYDIRVSVMWDWDAKAKRTKFAPGDYVRVLCVDYKCDHTSFERKCKISAIGRIIAVSQARPGYVRDGARAFTRYYVEFSDGAVHGFHSHFLKKVLATKDVVFKDVAPVRQPSQSITNVIELKVSEIESLYNLRHKLVEICLNRIRVKVIKD